MDIINLQRRSAGSQDDHTPESFHTFTEPTWMIVKIKKPAAGPTRQAASSAR